MTGLGSSKICNEHRIILGMNNVYVMQDVLVTTALPAAATYHSALVVICTRALCSFCVRVFVQPDLWSVN
jgi:hypothetical protein